MKTGLEIIVQTKDLVHALNFAGSVVEKRNVIGTLSNIKLTASGNNLEIGATDIDIYLNQTIGAEIIKEGQTTVSNQTLSDIVRKISDSEIKLLQSPGSEKLELIGKNCRFQLLTLPAEKFPNMEEVESELLITVSCKEFARLLEYTSFAMSNEETRYNLYGLYLHIDNNRLCSAATDGHRLSMAVADADVPATAAGGVIVPRKTVHELQKIVKDARNIEGEIKIIFGDNRIRFEMDNVQIVSKLIDQNFPEYSSFIPEDNESLLEVDRQMLADAIDRVAAITVDKFRAIKIAIGQDSIKITATGEAKGAAAEDLIFSSDNDAYCTFKGEEIIIGFNPRYISDVLGAIKEDRVYLYLKDTQSPVLIKANQVAKDSFVVMPVKV